MEGADFSGWATKSGIKCTDGRTIMPGAFAHQDKMQVPLVWQHGHTDPENVLGHAILEARDEGVYAYGFFNDTDKAKHTKGALAHKDFDSLSIWANQLTERVARVVHGTIREVSLVLAGANPGAKIENVSIRHSDDTVDVLDDEAIIELGLPVELQHADGDAGTTTTDDAGEDTVEEIYNSMTPQQQGVLHYMLEKALEDAADKSGGDTKTDDGSAEHSDTTDDKDKEGQGTMSRNVFDQTDDDKKKSSGSVLSHADMEGIVTAAQRSGSLKQAVEDYALAHGINDIDTLFPEATALTAAPEFFARRMEWVNGVLTGARKTPFSRIKTHWADLNFDDARAKGYIKGTLKKEEFFGTARRVTTPQTIYKKQKLDRDDIIDITDFDVVAWMRGEMRLMLDEELARAILIGDGRAVDDEDKIIETNIRPIATDDDLFTVVVNVNLDDASSSYLEIIESVILARQHYRGTGTPNFYTTETVIAKMLLLKDTLGRRLYSSLAEIAADMRVGSIIPVEVLEGHADVVGVIVNMSDYSIGADKGGQVSLFDDFDIDYNQYKYLIETRVSGALTKLKSAMVIKKVAAADALVVPNAPTFNGETGVVTVVATTGVVYKDGDGVTLTAGAQPALADGESLTVVATPAAGKYFATSEDDEWTFTFHADA